MFKKMIQALLLSLLIFPIFRDTSRTKKKSDAHWEERWKDLCLTTESDTSIAWCHWLKTKKGEWIEPNPDILKLISASKHQIVSVARLYQIDARAIAGAILAENTLNVDLVDDIQNMLVKLKFTPTAEFFGKKFSIGLGQVNMSAATAAEPTAARIEKRAVRDPGKIAELLLTPGGSICYVAAIIRQSQDAYLHFGYEIAHQPEILATLFNLGYPEDHAEASSKLKRKPRVNYFGYFVEKYLTDIESALGPTQDLQTRVIAGQVCGE